MTRATTLQHTEQHCNTPHNIATHCNTLQHAATRYIPAEIEGPHDKRHTATHCNTLTLVTLRLRISSTTDQHNAPHCNTASHCNTATNCNKLQHADIGNSKTAHSQHDRSTQCTALHCTTPHCTTLHHTAQRPHSITQHGITMQHSNTLQYTAPLQHTVPAGVDGSRSRRIVLAKATPCSPPKRDGIGSKFESRAIRTRLLITTPMRTYEWVNMCDVKLAPFLHQLCISTPTRTYL
jgi:hypothetical protein